MSGETKEEVEIIVVNRLPIEVVLLVAVVVVVVVEVEGERPCKRRLKNVVENRKSMDSRGI